MKTIIFNGSPRKNGDTAFLINELVKMLDGDVEIIDAYYSDIKPCTDCRYCHKNEGCCINDGMQDIFRLIDESDCIIIASPLYFGELTGQLLSLLSRLQLFYSEKYIRRNKYEGISKAGGVILCGGGSGGYETAANTAKLLLSAMNARFIGGAYSLCTDNIPACGDKFALTQITNLAERLNKNIGDTKT